MQNTFIANDRMEQLKVWSRLFKTKLRWSSSLYWYFNSPIRFESFLLIYQLCGNSFRIQTFVSLLLLVTWTKFFKYIFRRWIYRSSKSVLIIFRNHIRCNLSLSWNGANTYIDLLTLLSDLKVFYLYTSLW